MCKPNISVVCRNIQDHLFILAPGLCRHAYHWLVPIELYSGSRLVCCRIHILSPKKACIIHLGSKWNPTPNSGTSTPAHKLLKVMKLAETRMTTHCTTQHHWLNFSFGWCGEERRGQLTFPRKRRCVSLCVCSAWVWNLARGATTDSALAWNPPNRNTEGAKGREEECCTFTWQVKAIITHHSWHYLSK